MKIEITPTKQEVVEKPFPKLMISDDESKVIVLFVKRGVGLSLSGGKPWYSIHWQDTEWIDYEGKITLSND